MSSKKRCQWYYEYGDDLIKKYHDEEYGVLNCDDDYLFEILVLVNFQSGLSWETILRKREYFRQAYDSFDIDKVSNYDEEKVEELMRNEKIIRNKRKINAVINNAKVFKTIQKEFGSFYNYIKTFTNGEIFHEYGLTESELSKNLAKDLKKRGIKYIGSITMYSYLQTVGVINSHEKDCYLY
jgi:DNA-3-methyladenine glycosylase I